MALFQLIGCTINLGGDRNSVIVRSRYDNPVTYPELMILRFIHGGDEHVHHAMAVGEVEREHGAEFERLTRLYGDEVVVQMFPGGDRRLPTTDDLLPTDDEVFAGEAAAQAARSKARQKRRPKEMAFPASADALPEMPA